MKKSTTAKQPVPESASAKKQARRLAQRRSRQRARTIRVVATVAGLAALIAIIFLVTSNERAGAGGQIEGVQTFPNLERGHTLEPVAYAQTPPAGGRHHPTWQNCGVYTQPVPNENAVHSLEHGVIWITYRPDLDAAELQTLQDLTRQSGYRLLSPYPGLPSPIVLSAWGYQLQVESADDPRILDFIEAYEQNPRGPEPGAPCTGGVGQPE